MRELNRARTIIQELRRRRSEEALRYFVPTGGQEEFLAEVTRPGAFIIISGAGNGWGKSKLDIAICGALMWPDLTNKYFSHPFFKNWKYPKRARVYSSPAELEEIGSLQTAIQHYFPKGRYESRKGSYRYPSVFKSDTGWIMDLFSYERDEGEAAGPDIGLQIFNEPPPEPLWKEAVVRSRAGGIIIGGMTSLLTNPWIVDGVLNKANGEDIRVRYGSSCENCKQHGVRGNLEHAQIEKILEQYDPDEREARFTGKPLSFSGRILKTFDRRYHVTADEIIPPTSGVVHVQVVDPAIGKPLAVLWAYADAAGNISIYDEWPNTNFEGSKDTGLAVSDYIKIFREKEGGRRIERRILDRYYGNQRQTMGGDTLKEEFAKEGEKAGYPMEFEDSYKVPGTEPEIETGIQRIKDFLKFNKDKPIDNLNRPRLRVSPNCKNTIAALERHSRDPKTGKPMKQFKDHFDICRYLVMAEPVFEPPADWGNAGAGPAWGVRA